MSWWKEFKQCFVPGYRPPMPPVDEFFECNKKSTGPQSWQDEDSPILRTAYWRDRCFLAEKLVGRTLTKQEIGRACHIDGLEVKNEQLKQEVTTMRIVAELRNRQLDAANVIVYCNGGREGGIAGRPDKVNEELVTEVERTAKRLREWWENYQYRQKN